VIKDIENKLAGAIERSLAEAEVRTGSSVLVGLSGGADSVALISALIELRERLGLKISAAHLNHRIRGAESDRDEEFVRAMCARLGVELIVERAGGLDASTSSANLEERARDARREFLLRVAARVQADFVALGHHRDDQAETVLMRLMRGAGAAGMAAMADPAPVVVGVEGPEVVVAAVLEVVTPEDTLAVGVELPQAARARAEAATVTSERVRRGVMRGESFRAGRSPTEGRHATPGG